MQDAERQFAAENPVQISPDSQNRDCKQHETDPDADADHTVQQADAGFSKAVEYAGESGVQVQKRAHKAEDHNKMAGHFTVVQHPSHRGAERQKAHKADAAQQKAVSKAFADGFADDLLVICGIGLGNGGHEQYGNRVGQCAREKNKWQGHSRQYAVNTQGITDRMAVNLQLCRNTGGFNGLEDIQAQPVGA